MEKNIFAVIPAHNESKKIGDVIKKTKKYIKNIIVVDDGSTDDTYDVSKKEGAVVLKHIINMGKGAALKTGCDFALKNKADIIIAIDSDGQHDPNEIPLFLKAIENKNIDIVFGHRKLTKNMPFILRFGNLFISKLTKLLYNIRLKDTQCGFRAFTSEAYKKIRWVALDYSVESEMIAKAGKNKLKYAQVPIQTIYTDDYKGTTVIDGIKIIFNMFMWKIRSKKGELRW